MEKISRQKTFFIIGAAALTIAVFASGAVFGYSRRPEMEKVLGIFNQETEKPQEVDFGPFWKAWRIVEDRYAAADGVDRQKMVWGAISGALGSLGDPYTVFFPPEEKKLFESEIRGSFGGVGMEIGIKKGILTVVAPLKNTPASRAGIKAGDKILKIGEEETLDMTTEEAVKLIRGPEWTEVKLLLLQKNKEKPREVTLTREVIKIPVLDTEIREGGIFIIKLYNFSERSPYEFREALRKMKASGSTKLVLDLRNNPGGFLEAAVDVASWFLDTGKIVAREKFKNGDEQLYRSRGYKPFGELSMVILVNEGSASASEIVTGALLDHGIAKVVGEKTFGKGTVQELIDVTDNTSIKVTIARWLTPNGDDITKNGIVPDVEVEQKEEDEAEGRDTQMEKALETVRSL
ncbi:MAG: S41 family peptidase [Patescibacteria group bacterium]